MSTLMEVSWTNHKLATEKKEEKYQAENIIEAEKMSTLMEVSWTNHKLATEKEEEISGREDVYSHGGKLN